MMDISALPEELVEEIAAYLSADDMISCSTVNRQWRHAFINNNRVWKRVCTFHPEYFKKQTPKVKTTTEDFIEGCDSRKQFVQEWKVEKNIIKGEVHVEKIDIGRVYCDNILDLVDEVGNHWLIASCMDNQEYVSQHMFKVWDMREEPTLHMSVSSPLGVTRRVVNTEMELINKKIYYSSGRNVLVLEFNHPQYKLNFLCNICCPYSRHAGKFQDPVACTPNMVLAFCYTEIHHRESLAPWVSVYNLDGSVRYQNHSTAEFQEVEAKLNDFRSSRKSVEFYACFCNSSRGNVFLVVYSFLYLRNVPQTLSVMLFSLETFEFKTLFVKEVSKFISCNFDKDVFTVFYYVYNDGFLIETLTCFNSNGDLIYETQLDSKNGSPYHEVVTAKEGKEVLVLKSTGEVTVVDVFKQEHRKFGVPRLAQHFNGTVVNKNVIIIQHYKGNQLVTALWDYQQGSMLYLLDDFLAPYKSLRPEPLKHFSFGQNYLCPPKVFAVECPDCSFAKNINSKILVISFF